MAGLSKEMKDLLQNRNLIPQDPENRQRVPDMPPEVREKILGDLIRQVFEAVNLKPEDHMECFRAAVKKCNTNFFNTKTLAGWTCHKKVHKKMDWARDLSFDTGYLHCLPAPDLIVATLILRYRKIYSEETVDIIRWFEELKMCDFIDTAISVYAEHKTKVFHLQEPYSLVKEIRTLVVIHSDQDDKMYHHPEILKELDLLPREKLMINFNNKVKLVSGLRKMELEYSIWGRDDDALCNEDILTRAEVLEEHDELLDQVMKSGNDEDLESLVLETFGEREIQVLPKEWKGVLLTWSTIKGYDEFAATIMRHLDIDKTEISWSEGNAWKENETWLPGAPMDDILGQLQKCSEALTDDSQKRLLRVLGQNMEFWAKWAHANDVAMDQRLSAEDTELQTALDELRKADAGLIALQAQVELASKVMKRIDEKLEARW